MFCEGRALYIPFNVWHASAGQYFSLDIQHTRRVKTTVNYCGEHFAIAVGDHVGLGVRIADVSMYGPEEGTVACRGGTLLFPGTRAEGVLAQDSIGVPVLVHTLENVVTLEKRRFTGAVDVDFVEVSR